MSSSFDATYSPVSWLTTLIAVDLVAEELDPVHQLFVDRDELERVAAHPKRSAHQVEVVAPVLHPDQLAQKLVAVDRLADPNVG